MKRDIIFRGKRTDNGEWVYGFYSNTKGEDGRFHYIQNENLVVRVDPSTVGQYTGLTDKNGTKIFEGDIVHWEYQDYDNHTGWLGWIKHECKVTFEYGSFDIDAYPFHLGKTIDFDDGKDWRLEVIGNIFDSNLNIDKSIHENPELLEGGNK